MRAMLCEAAHCVRRKSHLLEPYFRRLVALRGYKIAIVAVAHRLLRIAWRMPRDGSDFDVGKLCVEVGPFESKVVRQFRFEPLTPARI